MGEIDTKPIEPVRNALSLFGDSGGDQKKYQPNRSKRDCEKELENLSKELANCKAQLEAKHAAHLQALLKLEHNHKRTYELSTLLKKSDIERNKYLNECTEGRARMDEIASRMKEMSDQHLETEKLRDQLSHVLCELKATQRELLNKDTELVAARDSEVRYLANAEKLENALNIEKEQKEELLQQVKELNEFIRRSKLAAIKSEKEKFAILSEKDENIELATKATAQAQKQVEDMRKQIEMLQGLQNHVALSSNESASSAMKDSQWFHTDMELKEKKIMDQYVYIEGLEMELNQSKQELMRAKEEINGLNITIESLTDELQKAKAELNLNKEKEIEAQVEITFLESQLQCHAKEEAEEGNHENNTGHIAISLKEYNSLVREANKANEVQVQASVVEAGSPSDIASLKRELRVSAVKIAELRARVEQALSRAELAEKAKAALEDKIKRQKEHRQRRRAAMNALREESTPNPFSPSTSDGTPRIYQPLGKVLNMKL